MLITFALPGTVRSPCGGFKVLYELANGLAKRSHVVHVVHISNPEQSICSKFWNIIARIRGRPRRIHIPWFNFTPAVKILHISNGYLSHIPDGEVIIGTGWQISGYLCKLPERKGRKLFYVQDFEHWGLGTNVHREDIRKAFSQPMDLISSSPAVSEMLRSLGLQEKSQISPGIDASVFDIDCPPERRDPFSVGLPVRAEGFKGTKDGLSAAIILRGHFGARMTVKAFGSISRPSLIPDWVDYVRFPNNQELRAFYNNISIFLFPSHLEGWGLPAMEAMKCGAAVVSSDCVGVRAFIQDAVTGVLVQPKNPYLLAASVGQLIIDTKWRCKLAMAGYESLVGSDWDSRVIHLEGLLTGDSDTI